MPFELYYHILNVDSGVTDDELKQAYHRAAKRNHPDLHPEERRSVQQLAMMRINEAYLSIVSARIVKAGGGTNRGEEGRDNPAHSAGRQSVPFAERHNSRISGSQRNLGALRDPAYAYYRRGFDLFRNGYSALFRKDPREVLRHLRESRTLDGYILQLTIHALKSFEQAYRYFFTVVEKYPESIWAYDARGKMRRVENYSAVYQRICDRVSESLSRSSEP